MQGESKIIIKTKIQPISMPFPSYENLYSVNQSSGNLIDNIMKGSDGTDDSSGSGLFDHPFFSLDTTTSPEFTLMVKNKENKSSSVVEITNSRNNNIHNSNNFACYSNEVISSESNNNMAAQKSKIPDILMINKYYGLIPQKFTISSRKTANSTPSSAGSNSKRCAKSNNSINNKPRAKSSTHHHHHQNRHERKSVEESNKGFRSENDSPEPIKMILISRRSSIGGCESPVEKSSDPFGPVTKKMSVERYKKWKNGGGGKGRNVSIRSSSDIGQTLSLLDNGLPGGDFNSHAKNNNSRASTTSSELIANRRVIKIDLNRVSSWDEENYRITTTSSLDSATLGENKEPELKVVVKSPTTTTCSSESDFFKLESRNTSTASNNNTSCGEYSFSSTCDSSQGESPIMYNGSDTSCLVNNGSNNDSDSLVANEEQTTFVSSIITAASQKVNETGSSGSIAFNSCGTLLEMSSSVRKESISDGTHIKELLNEACEVDENDDDNGQKNNKQLLNNALIGSCGSGNATTMKVCQQDKKVASMQRCGKLSSKTISFDDKSLDTLDGGVSSGRSESLVKKRPMTASARFNIKTFTTPNGFNPPSKVIPWTQQKTAGGKTLSVSERRAKFQRAPSIHSSSSLSMETGEEEALSEAEICVRPPSSAFRESRKPLHVTQPPEIPTMIAQINPNADEDIQIEIEKVALMLRKMQSMKNFSMSLDSGIEAEMARASSLPEDPMMITSPIKTVQSSASTDSVAVPEPVKILNTSASESSICSSDSQSSEEEEHPDPRTVPPQTGNKSTRVSSVSSTKSVNESGNNKNLRSGERTSNDIKRQCSINNTPHHNSNCSNNNNNIKKGSSIVSSQSSNNSTTVVVSSTLVACANTTTSTTVAARRPPLRKAVSISCEQELLKTGGDHKRNEVNFNANDNGKSPRPKTATAANSQYQKSKNVSGTRSIHNNYQYRQNNTSSLSGESHHATTTAGANAGSQGSRNRKILIKKALMEINQSSVNTRKKWGTLGRPRTAPSSDNSNDTVHQGRLTGSQQHQRKPLKASPFPISGMGKTGSSSSGKSASTASGKADSELMESERATEKSGPAGQIQRSSSEAPGDDAGDDKSPSVEQPNKGRGAFRQCISLDESALLGFSIKSVNGGRIPIFEKLTGAESTESCPTSIMDDEISFLSSKKREQCLKVYEKMMKTGCTIKLETVFRGMLTPSEYRAFMRAAERASQEEVEEETTDQITGEISLSNEENK